MVAVLGNLDSCARYKTPLSHTLPLISVDVLWLRAVVKEFIFIALTHRPQIFHEQTTVVSHLSSRLLFPRTQSLVLCHEGYQSWIPHRVNLAAIFCQLRSL